MVINLGGSGLRDWLMQRATAVLLFIYLLFIVGFCMFHTPLGYTDWSILFMHLPVRIFSLLALLSLVYHSWIGMWTVYTDYITSTFIRMIFQIFTFLALFSYFTWGVTIVWGL